MEAAKIFIFVLHAIKLFYLGHVICPASSLHNVLRIEDTVHVQVALVLKGIVSWDKYFFCKFCMSGLAIFTICGFLFAFMKLLTTVIVKVLPVALFRDLVPAFAACDSKSCSESRLWCWNFFLHYAMNVHLIKLTNDSKGMPEQKFDALSEQSLLN